MRKGYATITRKFPNRVGQRTVTHSGAKASHSLRLGSEPHGIDLINIDIIPHR